ncbi:MAG: protein kinase [Coriobacteriia bacterium]
MGDSLGPYQIRGELGRGAMAVVWRAFDSRLEREVAVKEPVMPPGVDAALASELAARFVREGRAAAQLNHPGIVTIHDADVYDGRPAIIMELIEGQTLAEILRAGPLEPSGVIAIADQLLDATSYAHARGIFHRDIKPDNVFITHDGRVKLADFGIAHVGTSATLTQAGTIMGTPGYMAPEQVTGGRIDARTDIFACGVVVYEMLTGSNPFVDSGDPRPTAVMYRIVHQDPPALPDLSIAGLAEDPRRGIAAAMSKDPGLRPADDEALRVALHGGAVRVGGATDPGFQRAMPSLAAQARAGGTVQAQASWAPWVAGIALGCVALAVLVIVMNSNAGGTSGLTPVAGSIVQTAPPVTPAPAAAPVPQQTPPVQPAATPAEPAATQADLTAEVEASLTDWAAAIGDSDLDRHMSHYADYVAFFARPSASNAEIRQIKADALAKYASFATSLDGVSVNMVSETEAVATFSKTSTRSQSDGVTKQDSVRQRLKLQLDGGTWKIVSEKDL